MPAKVQDLTLENGLLEEKTAKVQVIFSQIAETRETEKNACRSAVIWRLRPSKAGKRCKKAGF